MTQGQDPNEQPATGDAAPPVGWPAPAGPPSTPLTWGAPAGTPPSESTPAETTPTEASPGTDGSAPAAPPDVQPPAAWAPTAPASSSPTVHWAPAPPTSNLSVPGAPGLVYAGVIARTVAWLVDSTLLGLLVLIPSAVAGVETFRALDFDALARGEAPAPPTLTPTLVVLGVIVPILIQYAYFVGSWISRGRSTPGQRLFEIQVGRVDDGRTLTLMEAAIRATVLGAPLGLLSLLPTLVEVSSLAQSGLVLLVLLSTIGHPQRRGIHDLAAGSAAVRPERLGRNDWASGCLALLIIVGVIIFAGMLATVLFADQMIEILSQVGTEI